MKRKQRVKWQNGQIGTWPQVIGFTEERLRSVRQKATELEALLVLFRRLEAAGEPSPADLAGASKAGL
jgi:hypothetical protein